MFRRMILLALVAALSAGSTAQAASTAGTTSIPRQQGTRIELVLVPEVPPDQISSEQMQVIAQTIERRLYGMGVTGVVVQVMEAGQFRFDIGFNGIIVQRINTGRIRVRIEGVRLAALDTLIDTVTRPNLLEFVDFSAVSPGQIEDGACILTTEQVRIAESALPEGDPLPAYDQYTCPPTDPGDPSDPALLQPDGTPYNTVMTGAGIADAAAEPSSYRSDWLINFTLDKEGERVDAFLDYIANNANRPLAMVLDGRLLSYPTIMADLAQSAAAGTMEGGVITGQFAQDEAELLAATLRTGALAIPLRVESLHYESR